MATGSASASLDGDGMARFVDQFVARLRSLGPARRLLLVPPDITRRHSAAGPLTALLWQALHAECAIDVLPALGTHAAMSADEIARMFPGVPAGRFLVHDFRNDLIDLGVVPGEFVRHVSEGRLSYDIPVRVNRRLVDGGYDRIISIGQLVPHEVIGIANHNKNWLVGLGGDELIAKTHYLGAVFGMERIMGRARSPVRDVLDFASERLAAAIPITYLLTVRSMDAAGTHVTRGLFAGEGLGCYRAGAELSQVVNVTRLDRPIRTAVAWLDPGDYRSCWLANKAIYRLRMAMADGGELVVIAPGVRQFGEQPDLDRLIRRHGYRGTPATMEAVARDVELAGQLAAAAHLIHGSSEGRFTITYATPHLSRPEIEGVGFRWADPTEIARRYPLDRLAEGWNTIAGGEVFLTRHPGGGLWTV